jgi:uncharacterized Zn finger protein
MTKAVGIPCPKCGDRKTSVRRTKAVRDAFTRTRRCKGCGQTWSTFERTGGISALEAIDVRTYAATLIIAPESDPQLELRRVK